MRRFLVPCLVSLGLAIPTIAITAPPASATYLAGISTIDTSTPGHAKGTVTTDAPYLRIDLLNVSLEPMVVGEVSAVSAGVKAFDMETWGMEYVYVRALPCSSPSTCVDPDVISGPTATTTVSPVVTWPEDTTIGNQDYVVQVDDHASGGGILQADYSSRTQVLDPEGSTSLTILSEYGGSIRILRCHPQRPGYCLATGIERNVTVVKSVGLQIDDFSPYYVSPTVGVQPTFTFRTTVPDLTVDWHLESEPGGATVPGFGGSSPTTPVPGSAVLRRFSADLTGLANGTYSIAGTASYVDPEYGFRFSNFAGPQFWVDNDAPVLESVATSGPTVYPVADDYLDWVKVDLHGAPGTSQDQMKVQVLDSVGTVVRTIKSSRNLDGNSERFLFKGRTDDGALLPEGDYTVRGIISDAAGNSNEMLGPVISVSHLKLVKKVFSKTVTPAASYQKQFVGACSQIKRPARRGWGGSFGLYSNTRCTRGEAASFVETHHAVQVPEAIKYGDAEVSVYGGAAAAKRDSIAVLAFYKANDDWGYYQRVGPSLGSHASDSPKAVDVLDEDRWLYWAILTGLGMRYDVKNFTVKVDYYVLVPA